MVGEESRQEGRLHASKTRWRFKEAEKRDYMKAKREGNMVRVESNQEGKYTYKQGEMEIWWGRRATKKGYYRQARRDGDTEKPKRETIGKRGGMEI